MTQLKHRNPLAFDKKIPTEEEDSALIIKYSRGCNCKKSGYIDLYKYSCKKKYCECYQLGLKCTDICKCRDC